MTIEEVDNICQRFFELAVRPLRNIAFEQEWNERNLTEPYYYSLAYFCVAAVLDDKSRNNDVDNLHDAARVLEYIEVNDQDYQHGSVMPWSRISDVRRALGDQQGAIAACNDGLETLTKCFDWHPGELLPAEMRGHQKYSKPEILYAQRGRSQLEISDFDAANASFSSALESLHVRGRSDLVNNDFPEGISKLLARAKQRQTTTVIGVEPSAEARQVQQQQMGIARMLTRLFGR